MRIRVSYAVAAALGIFGTLTQMRDIPRVFSLVDHIRGTAAQWVVVIVILSILFAVRNENPRRVSPGGIIGASLVAAPLALTGLVNSPAQNWPWIASGVACAVGAASLRQLGASERTATP